MMFKVTYKLHPLNAAEEMEIDTFCSDFFTEVTKMANHWSMRKWKEYIQMILVMREGNNLSVVIPNPIKVPASFMKQFTKKMKVEKNMEKWLNAHGYKDYEKVRKSV